MKCRKSPYFPLMKVKVGKKFLYPLELREPVSVVVTRCILALLSKHKVRLGLVGWLLVYFRLLANHRMEEKAVRQRFRFPPLYFLLMPFSLCIGYSQTERNSLYLTL